MIKILKNRYNLCLGLILLLAILLRFYRFNDRWFIFADSARDVLVAREALKLGLANWPLVGSFSSAGPFVFGPLFYWLISLSYLPSINTLILPWITIGIVSIAFVWVMGKAGKKFGGPIMGLLLAFLAAVSPAQNFRSLGLTQHTLIGISGAIILLAFIAYLKNYKTKNLFLMGLGIGLGLSMHYQAINFLFYGIAIFLVKKFSLKKIIKNFTALFIGLLIPSLPLLYWDSLQGWNNTLNILDYLLIGQYRIYVANRWLTFLSKFWPQFWSTVIGGSYYLGWLFMLLVVGLVIKKLVEKKLDKTIIWLGLIFLTQVILLRYHRGEMFEGYIIYFHPLILFFSAWALTTLWQKWRFAGLALLLVITSFSFKNILELIKTSQNQRPVLEKVTNQIKERFPGQKFTLWDYKLSASAYSFGISAFLDSQNLIDSDGVPIGICLYGCPETYPIISQDYKPTQVVVLPNKPREVMIRDWRDVNPQAVFKDVALWWQKEKLKSPFSLRKYISERFDLGL